MTTETVTPLSQVETDSFCDCGYNLHGQPVWRDERLELLVCRCPECGRHAAAGRFTGIHSTWLHRLSLGLIILWVLALIKVFLFLTIMSGVWPGVFTETFIRIRPIGNETASPTLYMYDVMNDSGPWARRNWGTFIATIYTLAGLTGLVLGGIAATCLWHLRGRVYLAVLAPAMAVGYVYFLWAGSPTELTAAARFWIATRLTSFAVVECGAVVVGITFGRPIARFVLQLLLPQRLLQHLAFLWLRDGKALPPMQKS